MQIQHPLTAPLELIHGQLDNCLHAILTAIKSRDIDLGELSEASMLLEALPLSSSEFAVAANRLGNIRRYLVSGEHGAAQYEVQLLMRSINHTK